MRAEGVALGRVDLDGVLTLGHVGEAELARVEFIDEARFIRDIRTRCLRSRELRKTVYSQRGCGSACRRVHQCDSGTVEKFACNRREDAIEGIDECCVENHIGGIQNIGICGPEVGIVGRRELRVVGVAGRACRLDIGKKLTCVRTCFVKAKRDEVARVRFDGNDDRIDLRTVAVCTLVDNANEHSFSRQIRLGRNKRHGLSDVDERTSWQDRWGKR